MKKKMLFICTVLSVVVTVVGIKSIDTHSGMSELMIQNIEVLTRGETEGAMLQCKNQSVVIYCQVTCKSCGHTWRALSSGPVAAVRGNCSCGEILTMN